MWLMGGSSGLLWSTGNIFSMISVRHLGEGVGYSVCQAAMLISGLWGIYYFREVVRQESIVKWFASALLTVCGILLLSYQHHAKR
jgi:glucose uptake protein GlcU